MANVWAGGVGALGKIRFCIMQPSFTGRDGGCCFHRSSLVTLTSYKQHLEFDKSTSLRADSVRQDPKYRVALARLLAYYTFTSSICRSKSGAFAALAVAWHLVAALRRLPPLLQHRHPLLRNIPYSHTIAYITCPIPAARLPKYLTGSESRPLALAVGCISFMQG